MEINKNNVCRGFFFLRHVVTSIITFTLSNNLKDTLFSIFLFFILTKQNL